MGFKQWQGGGGPGPPTSGDWNTDPDWVGPAPPADTDTVLLGGGTTTYTVTLGPGEFGTAANVLINDANATLDVQKSALLDVTGTILDSGHLTLEDSAVLAQTLSIGAGGTATVSQGGFLGVSSNLGDSGTLTVTGTGSVVSANTLTDSGSLTVAS